MFIPIPMLILVSVFALAGVIWTISKIPELITALFIAIAES